MLLEIHHFMLRHVMVMPISSVFFSTALICLLLLSPPLFRPLLLILPLLFFCQSETAALRHRMMSFVLHFLLIPSLKEGERQEQEQNVENYFLSTGQDIGRCSCHMMTAWSIDPGVTTSGSRHNALMQFLMH